MRGKFCYLRRARACRSLWPRPGSDKPLEKTTFYTKVGDQVCGVGYYKG